MSYQPSTKQYQLVMFFSRLSAAIQLLFSQFKISTSSEQEYHVSGIREVTAKQPPHCVLQWQMAESSVCLYRKNNISKRNRIGRAVYSETCNVKSER